MVESEANVQTFNLRPNPAHILCDRNRRWNRNGPGQLVSDADQAVIHVSFVVYRTRFCSVVMVIRELNSTQEMILLVVTMIPFPFTVGGRQNQYF